VCTGASAPSILFLPKNTFFDEVQIKNKNISFMITFVV
jgi:hypothetical protein